MNNEKSEHRAIVLWKAVSLSDYIWCIKMKIPNIQKN